MKRFLLLSLALLMPILAMAQTGTYTKDAVFAGNYPGETVRFTCALDSIDADTSRTFSLGRYDSHSFSDAPIWVQRKITSAAGKPYVTVYIDGTIDGTNWFACDTLVTADSTETAGLIQLNLNNKKFTGYRMRANGVQYGSGKNRSDTIFDTIWYLYHRD